MKMKPVSCPIEWSRPEMTKPADSIQSSNFTWSEPPSFEAEGPLDMSLLMQHYYGRAWRIAKQTHEYEKAVKANLNNAFLERQCIIKAKIHRQKMAMNVKVEKPRYIYPKFRNIPSRIDTYRKVQASGSTNRKVQAQ
uniref:50S ribosomal protein L17 n=1 Tax=Lygus hesperus TaxID=30085 RepID=A0A0A9WWU9_LYGHE